MDTPGDQTRLRFFLTMAAYAYEKRNEPIMSDADFDAGCRLVDLSVQTNRPHLDHWWRQNFDPNTGMWINRHPELLRIAAIYDDRFRGRTFRLDGGKFLPA